MYVWVDQPITGGQCFATNPDQLITTLWMEYIIHYMLLCTHTHTRSHICDMIAMWKSWTSKVPGTGQRANILTHTHTDTHVQFSLQ